jgi:outer membrane protein OmpA-like peptidoglycan-associated protein
MKRTPHTGRLRAGLALSALAGSLLALAACNSTAPKAPDAAAAAPAPAGAIAPVAGAVTSATPAAAPATAPVAAPAARPATAVANAAPLNTFVAPEPVPFEEAIARSGTELFAQARERLGAEARTLVIDPLIDANTGAQTVSTARMGDQIEAIAKAKQAGWKLKPLTRESLAERPLLMIGTLTPVNVERAVDTVPDAFRVWLTLIDLRDGRVIAKQLDRATVGSVNPEPLKFYADSPTWHKDKTVLGYINSCQINTKIGDPADPEYLARLPAAAVVNEAILAYGAGKTQQAHQLYLDAQRLADPGDLRVLNGLYLTSWQMGKRDLARNSFAKLVDSGIEQKRLPVKLLFQPGRTTFNAVGDLGQQYPMWISAVAEQAARSNTCIRIVGHTSRTGSARANETLSRQRAEAVQRLLEQNNRTLSTRLTAAGVGSREALVGLGTDDQRDALDRRVEFRVVDCV